MSAGQGQSRTQWKYTVLHITMSYMAAVRMTSSVYFEVVRERGPWNILLAFDWEKAKWMAKTLEARSRFQILITHGARRHLYDAAYSFADEDEDDNNNTAATRGTDANNSTGQIQPRSRDLQEALLCRQHGRRGSWDVHCICILSTSAAAAAGVCGGSMFVCLVLRMSCCAQTIPSKQLGDRGSWSLSCSSCSHCSRCRPTTTNDVWPGPPCKP